MLIQIHILQNYAPSNLNRDDTGSPKDAIIGTTRRGRISSQCLKRSMRRSPVFVDAFAQDGLLATRTQLLAELVDAHLATQGVPAADRANIVRRLPELGGGKAASADNPRLKTSLLVFLSPEEVAPVADGLLALYNNVGSKKYAELKMDDIESVMVHALPRSVDVAMFGRMTTSVAFEDVQAAVQVAHAFSTNALEREFDYFTAVDDISNETGAGMIGDVEFNSSTYYKYINVHWEKLVENLGGDTAVARRALVALLQAAALAQPTGKQNTFAAHNLPDFMLVEVTSVNVPVSYANAFLKPARAGYQATLMEDSIEKLIAYGDQLRTAYSLTGNRAALNVNPDGRAPALAVRVPSLQTLSDWTIAQLVEAPHA